MRGTYISKVKADSPAARCGTALVGMKITAVDGETVADGMTRTEVVELIKMAGDALQIEYKTDAAGFKQYQKAGSASFLPCPPSACCAARPSSG